MQLDPAILYACGEEGGGVAGRIQWETDGTVLTWVQPGGRQRAYRVSEVIQNDGEHYAFRDDQGRTFVLKPLTLDLYNEVVRLPGQPRYLTLQGMYAAYEASLANG